MIQGERFEINLDDDDGVEGSNPILPAAFVGDIMERKPAAATPNAPTPPGMKSKTGFPEHKKRTVTSRFKQQKAASASGQSTESSNTSSTSSAATPSTNSSRQQAAPRKLTEREQIDAENQQRLAQMTPAEIEEERRELMESLSPEFLQRLLQRPSRQNGEQMQKMLRQADIGSGSNEGNLYGEGDAGEFESKFEEDAPKKSKSTKTVTFAETTESEPQPKSDELENKPADAPPLITVSNDDEPQEDSIHFPRPPQPPSLDPSSSTFLEDLHSKYFPELPSDPEKLSWMQSSSSKNTYGTHAQAFAAKDLRFGFSGELLPPSTSASIPVTAGLHHHGDNPESAGYTIPELAHLSRSSYPAQRCIAFQTLGRILYRLGSGEFGDAGEPAAEDIGTEPQEMKGELARGLWHVIENQRIVQNLVSESEGNGVDKGRHVSARSYATEAVWLWQKGGGRRWKAG